MVTEIPWTERPTTPSHIVAAIQKLQERFEVWGHGTPSVERHAKPILEMGFVTRYSHFYNTAFILPPDNERLAEYIQYWPHADERGQAEALVLIVIPKDPKVDYSQWTPSYGFGGDSTHERYFEMTTGRRKLKDEHLYGYVDLRTMTMVMKQKGNR